jgi:hypothetical protein
MKVSRGPPQQSSHTQKDAELHIHYNPLKKEGTL